MTWNQDTYNPNYFIRFPRTEKEAINQGFRKIGDCDLTANWRGRRYVRDEDYTVIMLYDVNGYVAGIQTAITKTAIYPPSTLQPPFIDDGSRSVLTAYFVDPSIICTTGRSAYEFATQGTGTRLYIQNSTTPEFSTRVPSTLVGVRRTKWTEGRCVPIMGVHFYYSITKEIPCDDIFPAVLLYNKGQLTAFAWMFIATFPSKRYEVSQRRVFPFFINPVPRCLEEDYEYLTTQHVYLTDDYTLNRC